jgi:hypothetical protein
VIGCGRELKEEKAYNIRYKVCGDHLIAPEVEMAEGKVRFCQQCARFQPMRDFDGLKRSCRQRLQLHNTRGRVAYQQSRSRVNADRTETPDSAVSTLEISVPCADISVAASAVLHR